METKDPNPFKNAEVHYFTAANMPHQCCCLLFSLLFAALAFVSAATLFVFFVVRPKKPIFHLHSVQLHSFKLDTSSLAKGVSVSSSMASLLFVTQNSNRLGIRYSPAVLGVLYETVPVGAVEVPAFYQPACSKNVSVTMHVSIGRFNVTDLIGGTHVEIQLLGVVGVQLHVLNFPLPRIKVSLDCKISMDYGFSTLSKGVESIRRHKALLLSNFPHPSQKCSLAVV